MENSTSRTVLFLPLSMGTSVTTPRLSWKTFVSGYKLRTSFTKFILAIEEVLIQEMEKIIYTTTMVEQ